MEINLYPKVKAVLIPLFIFILAFSIRIAYLEQIKTNPFFEPDAGGLDDSFYHAWAKEIAAGNVVGKEVFWGLPLYPYFLGLVYFLTGCSVYAAFFMQFVIGSLNCVLVYYIGKRVFSEAAGILSGVMLALYRPSIFYEGLRSASFLSLFLNCIIILLILRIIEKPFLRGWLLTGVLIGLSGLSSAAIFMFLPFLLFWILRYYQDGKKMICCVLVLAGVLLIIGATAVRNYLVAKDFVPVTCHSGITFYASNNPDSFGLFHLPQDLGGNINLIRTNSKVYAEQVLKKQLKPSEISDFWFRKGLEFIKQKPLQYLKFIAVRFLLFWNSYEISDVLNMDLFIHQFARFLVLPFLSFAFILPLSVLGIAITFKKRNNPQIMLLYLLIASWIVALSIYFVNARYRLPIVPFLIVFAAGAAVWLVKTCRRGDLRLLFLATVIMALVSLPGRMNAPSVPGDSFYNRLGIIYMSKDMYAAAEKAYRTAEKLNPRYAIIHYNLGLLYARKEFEVTIKLEPGFYLAYNELGQVYMRTGRKEQAMACFKKSISINPHQPKLGRYLQ